ncbi:Uncharacterized protein TCAP_03867 [Tolypocladium capitatum]|uniref:Ricin B lectin domain-containing protein n=1 Tax=Tolypocladium capitatum TaxID=45235 RepID=A0A2K3QF92_9HYPO|nr:Uncharacterized protein TCAP_03867 [Tolypocladium capitatum]
MFSIKLLALFCTAATAAVLPRSQYVPDGSCCFTLHDAATGTMIQQEQRTGFLFLHSSQPNGWYCLDVADKRTVLVDDFDNACIIDSYLEFQCLDPTPGLTQYSLQQSGSQVLLKVDGTTDYKACPAQSGGEMIWGTQRASDPGCRTLQLTARDFKGTCNGFSG